MSVEHRQNEVGASERTSCASTRRSPTRSSVPLEAIHRHIRMNLTARIRVSDMANIAGVNVFRLASAIRRECQMTPYALVIATRIEVAMQLLRNGMSVADVAVTAGFSDQSHLTRHFRRRVGTTPSKLCSRRKIEAI
jgi:AraC-like DNA-binding protein